MAASENRSSRQDLANAIVGWYRLRFGRGPTDAKVYTDDNHVLVVLRHLETTVERVLVEHGHAELVRRLRRTVRETHYDELRELVAEKASRPVLTVLSDHHAEHDVTGLIFLLEPASDPWTSLQPQTSRGG
jgi:uncharacterized protein YbcI